MKTVENRFNNENHDLIIIDFRSECYSEKLAGIDDNQKYVIRNIRNS